ncbi:hypothetical protein [Sorangium sp. So ce1153]|uniref:hypothetical protein n=1 Tax=Sorangium sp. So ce1153 TaxID=3133333 RepID=UPI003F634BCF
MIALTLDVLAGRKVTVFAHRVPMLLLRFDGSSLLRREESRSDALLFQLPPRITPLEASFATPSGPCGRPRTSARVGRADPAVEHPADLVALAGEVKALGLGDAAEGVGEPHEDARADEAARGGGEVGALVATVRRPR